MPFDTMAARPVSGRISVFWDEDHYSLTCALQPLEKCITAGDPAGYFILFYPSRKSQLAGRITGMKFLHIQLLLAFTDLADKRSHDGSLCALDVLKAGERQRKCHRKRPNKKFVRVARDFLARHQVIIPADTIQRVTPWWSSD